MYDNGFRCLSASSQDRRQERRLMWNIKRKAALYLSFVHNSFCSFFLIELWLVGQREMLIFTQHTISLLSVLCSFVLIG